MNKLNLSVGSTAYVTSSGSIYEVVVTGISPTGRITTYRKSGEMMYGKQVWWPNGGKFGSEDKWNFSYLREADHPDVIRRIAEDKRETLIERIEYLIKKQNIEVLEQVLNVLNEGEK